MKIYTKTGDDGETGLFGGERVSKDSPRIEAYGAVDELNSAIGIVRASRPGDDIDAVLKKIQADLFDLGADLATRKSSKRRVVPNIKASHIKPLEKFIDTFQDSLPPLESFVFPGGSPAAAQLHFARTVCRRAEVHAVRLSRTETVNRNVCIYLNRLSDLLFVLARYANSVSGGVEVRWTPRSKKR
jgi:cob(I)alamin adenosyltransferase